MKAHFAILAGVGLLVGSDSPPALAQDAPEATARLVIRVTDAEGKPVEGAVVVARPSTGGLLPFGSVDSQKTRTTITDTRGDATLEAMPGGPWTLEVLARGYAARTLRRVESGPLDVRLERGGAITGIVADAEGVPLPGAHVLLDMGRPLPDAWAEEARRVEATTDDEGRFRLEGIGYRPVTVAARAPGYGRATWENVEAGAHVELFLFPGATLAGSVVDEEGQPLEGALVQAAGGGLWTKAPPSERTDADGSFVVAGVEEGEYVVMAREGGQAPGLARVVVEGEEEAFVEVVVTPGGFATGRVVDAFGEPLAARVEAVTFEGVGLPAFARDRFRTDTREGGSFVLGPLPVGLFELEAFVPGHAAERVEARVGEAGATADLGDVVVDRGGTIRGRVLDQEGAGVAGARLRAWPQSGRPRHWPEADSQEDGSFEVGGLDEGRHTLSASKPGYAEAQTQVQAGDEAVELVLEVGGEVVGRVIDADGRPAADALIQAERAGTESRITRPSAFARVEDEDGRFALRDVRAGTWVLKAQASGRGEATLPGVRVHGGRTTDVGTVRLSRGGVIRGAVVDADGVGIPGATVQAERDVHSRTGRLAAQSGGSGAFEIRGVPAGRFAVFARHPAHAPAPRVDVEVDPESEPVPVRLVLTRGGRLEGVVLHRDGRPFEEGRIMTQALGPGQVRGPSPGAAIAPDGWYSLDHVAPGRTHVHVMVFSSRSPMGGGGPANILTAVVSREVDVRDGETSTVDFQLRDVVVAGQVTRGSQPAPMIHLGLMGDRMMVMHFAGADPPRAASGATGPQPLTGVTGEDGRYELLVYSPGTYHTRLKDLFGGQDHPSRQVEIPDVARFELDIELASSEVSGVLVEAETGEPVARGAVRLARGEPEGSWAGAAPAGPDGRFSLPVEPGAYRLTAEAPGHRPVTMKVDIGPAGLEDLRIEMEAGLEVQGRVVDGAGRPVGGVRVGASDEDGHVAHTESLPDGTFRLGGLDDRPYALAAGAGLAGFAIRLGVRPAQEPLLLRLGPGGRVSVHVRDAAGQPVKDAWPGVRSVEGVRLHVPGLQSGMTGPDGVTVIDAPAATVGIEVRLEDQRGRGTVTVRPGETVTLEIVLEPNAPAEES